MGRRCQRRLQHSLGHLDPISNNSLGGSWNEKSGFRRAPMGSASCPRRGRLQFLDEYRGVCYQSLRSMALHARLQTCRRLHLGPDGRNRGLRDGVVVLAESINSQILLKSQKRRDSDAVFAPFRANHKVQLENGTIRSRSNVTWQYRLMGRQKDNRSFARRYFRARCRSVDNQDSDGICTDFSIKAEVYPRLNRCAQERSIIPTRTPPHIFWSGRARPHKLKRLTSSRHHRESA
jgi:hypothetical protein